MSRADGSSEAWLVWNGRVARVTARAPAGDAERGGSDISSAERTQAKRPVREPERGVGPDARAQLLAGIPVVERRLELAGIPTAVLEGGAGRSVVLLHGPGESAAKWRWILPALTSSHHVVAPDLPAHGSTPARGPLDHEHLLAWLTALIESCCDEPPALVGHVLGGAIAARFAIARGELLTRLVLVDSLGLARFRPSPRFALGLAGFLARPSEGSFERFMRQCAFDLDDVRERMEDDWAPFASYNVELARASDAKAAGRLFRELGLPKIPADRLARIAVPTSLIWGRHDRAIRLRVAERAAVRFGWPLRVIDDVADDPARDQPEAFVRALRAALVAPPARGGQGDTRQKRGRGGPE